MNHEKSSRDGWVPLQGSWEEAVLSWHEQVQTAFRRHRDAEGTLAVPDLLFKARVTDGPGRPSSRDGGGVT